MSWEDLERGKKELTEEEKAERQQQLEKENLFNIALAKTFSSDHGKIVLERWKRTTTEQRISLVLTNPQTGQRYPNPDSAVYARIGEENFIKDILTRIERAKSV